MRKEKGRRQDETGKREEEGGAKARIEDEVEDEYEDGYQDEIVFLFRSYRFNCSGKGRDSPLSKL